MAKTSHWCVKYTRAGMEPPMPFGRTSTVVCAASRDEAKAKVSASPWCNITASRTAEPVSFLQTCYCDQETP